jgi:hypothetical protein
MPQSWLAAEWSRSAPICGEMPVHSRQPWLGMEALANIDTDVRHLRQKQGGADKYCWSLSITPGPRYFEHLVANERDDPPRPRAAIGRSSS